MRNIGTSILTVDFSAAYGQTPIRHNNLLLWLGIQVEPRNLLSHKQPRERVGFRRSLSAAPDGRTPS
ncbi:hypothetical protein CHS0354_019057 [Potamilus streckersoni]|uniref:Uncharacterized protein n=1 Tax=Potamilus streckersoni TaxID=2493646 RepID=A0AAE0VWS8_9BIVA|nr:hypothetical protein CHS0354_019057 [Potamilus streckersoni]